MSEDPGATLYWEHLLVADENGQITIDVTRGRVRNCGSPSMRTPPADSDPSKPPSEFATCPHVLCQTQSLRLEPKRGSLVA